MQSHTRSVVPTPWSAAFAPSLLLRPPLGLARLARRAWHYVVGKLRRTMRKAAGLPQLD